MTVRVLGPIDVGDRRLSPREAAILSALIVRIGEAVPREELADAYWGERAPSTWSQQVKTSIARIRGSLGADAVVTRAGRYQLGLDPESIDLVRFERLVSTARSRSLRDEPDRAVDLYERALSLWRGRPFADLVDWEPAAAEAARLIELRSGAEEELLDARLALGEHRAVIADAERLVRDAPLREGRWSTLAVALYRADRQSDALAVLREARRRLDDQLGVEPSARLTELETAILRQDVGLQAPALASAASAVCPYRGLTPYGVDDADGFFGRDQGVEQVLERLRPGRLVAVTGASGTGKSSLVLAGVIPRLRSSGRAVRLLDPRLEPQWSPPGSRSDDVLAIDQGEEIVAAAGPALQRLTGAVLATLRDGGAVVLTIRSDALDQAVAVPELGPLIAGGLYAVGPLDAGSLEEIVERPAAAAGLRVEPGLVDLIQRDALERSGVLPHLSHSLVETWRRREGATLTVAGYRASGGIAGAIAESAEQVYRGLDAAERDACRSIALRLIERRPDGAAVRRRPDLAGMQEVPVRRAVLERLLSARLVTIEGGSLVIAHEAVATAWPRLDGWLEEDAEASVIRSSLATAAEVWQSGGRDDADLLRGTRLEAAQAFGERATEELLSVERDLLESSTARATSELRALQERARIDASRTRRLRLSLGGASALLVAAIVAGAVAVDRGAESARNAADAQIEALASTSLALRDGDREGAALLAAEMYRRWPDDPRTRSALMGSITASNGYLGSRSVDTDERVSMDFDATTGALVTLIGEDRIRIEDPETGRVLDDFTVPLTPGDAEFWHDLSLTPDGTRAVILEPLRDPDGECCFNRVEVVDLRAHELVGEPILLETRTSNLPAISDDGTVAYFVHPITSDVTVVDLTAGSYRVIDLPGRDGPLDSQRGANSTNAVIDPTTVAIGGQESVVFVDTRTLDVRSAVALPGLYANDWAEPDGAGGVIVSGPRGIARVDAGTATVRWAWPAEKLGAGQCGFSVVDVERGVFFCSSEFGQVEERRLDSGLPTGRSIDTTWRVAPRLGLRADGSELLLADVRTRAYGRWRLDGGGLVSRLIAPGMLAIDGFGGDGRYLVTSPRGPDGDPVDPPAEFVLWDVAAGRAERRFDSLVFWAGPNLLVDFEADPWEFIDVRDGAVVALEPDPDLDFALQEGSLWATGDDRLAYAIGPDRVVGIDPLTGRTTGMLVVPDDAQVGNFVYSISPTPDRGGVVVTWQADDRQRSVTTVHDARTGEELSRGRPDDIASVVTTDGRVVSLSDFGELHTGPLDDLTATTTLRQPLGGVGWMQLSRDDRTLMIVSPDSTVSLYDLAGSRQLGDVLVPDSGPFIEGFLDPSGDRFVLNTRQGVVLWDIAPSALFEAACQLAGRELTAAEWATYLGDEGASPSTCAGVLGPDDTAQPRAAAAR